MSRVRTAPAVAVFVGTATAFLALPGRSSDRTLGTLASWDSVKLTIAQNSVTAHVRFWKSLRLWSHPDHAERAVASGDVTVFDGDVTSPVTCPPGHTVHIRGHLASQLRVGEHSEVVVRGSVLKGGRIDAEGIVAIHVQNDVEGVVACTSSAELWIGRNLRGEVLTGMPVLHLHVGGDLTGSVRPEGQAALLYIGVQGYVAQAVVASIQSNQYTELQISTGSSDVAKGIHPLPSRGNGFLAVTGLGSGR